MLEIILIWRLAVNIGNGAEQKGLKKIGYQIMAVLLWLCGEFLGGILGYAFFGSESSFWLRYVMALIGAIAGAAIAFLVMRFIPKQAIIPVQNDSEVHKEASPIKKFGRSNWVPAIVVLLAVICLCAGFGVAVIAQTRSMVQQIHASNPIIGIEVDNSGQITQPVNEISSKANAIYFGFNFEIPQGGEMPVTFDVYIDGQMAYTYSKTLGQGQVVVPLEKYELREFNKGNYKVIAHIGELLLTSAEFVVK
jgi:hypothetical protein